MTEQEQRASRSTESGASTSVFGQRECVNNEKR